MSQANNQTWHDQDLGRRELHRENKRLQQKLDELMGSISQYRATQTKYESFELALLESESFYDVIDGLLNRLRMDFKLDAIKLNLFDPDGIARELLMGKHTDFRSLTLVENYQHMTLIIRELQAKRLFPGGAIGHMRPQLTTEQEAIKSMEFHANGIRSMAFLPLIRDHLLIGYLVLGSQSERRFNPNLAIDLLSHLAAVTSVCIENSLSREQLRQLSQIDMLTRVKNRRAFDLALRKEIARAQRHTNTLSCLYVDLDHFKQINDSYGHATGDRVLKSVAQSVQDMLRESDTMARIGGEEFTVLLPNTGANGSADIAERIRARVESLEVPDDQGMVVKLTTSIGYTCWSPGMIANETIDDVHRRLMGNADKAVYNAKEHGRNRVENLPYATLRDDGSADGWD
jgi:two-component system cell cycle response regulator